MQEPQFIVIPQQPRPSRGSMPHEPPMTDSRQIMASADDALAALLDLPKAYRVTALALVGVPDPFSYEQSRHDMYIELVNQLAADGRASELIKAVSHINMIRREAREGF